MKWPSLVGSLVRPTFLARRTARTMEPAPRRDHSQKVEFVKQHVASYPDFPQKGILFRDIFSVLNHVEAAEVLNDLVTSHVLDLKCHVDAVIGLESRGFLFGPQIARALTVPFVPVRKKGKLPGELVRMEYTLEYSKDVVEVQKESLVGKTSVLIVDDLLATGGKFLGRFTVKEVTVLLYYQTWYCTTEGTMKAAYDLVKSCGVEVAQCLVIMELASLAGRSKIPAPVHSIIVYD